MERKQLEEAISHIEEWVGRVEGTRSQLVLEAAKAHLATLPPEPKNPPLDAQIVAVTARIFSPGTGNTLLRDHAVEAASDTLRALDEFRKAWYHPNTPRDARYDIAHHFLLSLGLVDSIP